MITIALNALIPFLTFGTTYLMLLPCLMNTRSLWVLAWEKIQIKLVFAGGKTTSVGLSQVKCFIIVRSWKVIFISSTTPYGSGFFLMNSINGPFIPNYIISLGCGSGNFIINNSGSQIGGNYTHRGVLKRNGILVLYWNTAKGNAIKKWEPLI